MAGGSQASPNIVLVSIDGLRADHTGPGGHHRETTPVLSGLLREGVWFENAFSQSNESLHSHASIMVSQYPTEISGGEYLFYTIPHEALTLAEVLNTVGYETGGFVAGGHIKENFGFSQGFNHFESSSVDFGSFFETVPQALRWISKRTPEKPWFAFVHGYDCHRPYAHTGLFWHPFDSEYEGIIDEIIESRNETERIFHGIYYPKADLRRVWHKNGERMLDPAWYADIAAGNHNALGQGVQLSPRDLKHLKAHYDSGVLVADTYLGLLVDQLKRTKAWDDLVMIILSDHGEDLQDHGFTNHRAVLHDSTTHVPFLITGGAVPKSLYGKSVREPVDALDVMPTITTIAGTVAPSHARGRDLWTAIQTNRIESNGGILQQGVLGQISLRNETHRLTFSGVSIQAKDLVFQIENAALLPANFQLYDVHSDRGEQNNIVEKQKDTADRMRKEMVDRLKQLRPAETEDVVISRELKKALQSRGYW